MKLRALLSISFCITLFPSIFSQSWVIQSSGTLQTINDIHFVDINTGYAACSGGILIKTTNSGNNWFSINVPFTSSLNKVRFFDQNTGLVFASPNVYKTTNGGTNWVQVANYYSTDCSIGDNNTIFAVNSPSPVKSTNRGDNWSNTGVIPPFGANSLFFLNAQTGWAATIMSSMGIDWVSVVKTMDGNNWVVLYNTMGVSGAAAIRRFYFVNESIGYLLGKSYRTIEKTTNGGSNWQTLISIDFVYGLHFADANTGWVCGGAGLIIKTTNGGQNWIYPIIPTSERLNCIQFLDHQTGWAAGFNGMILKTTNGGITGINTINNEVPEEYSLSQNYPNPFNPTTNIKFQMPKSGFVKLTVFDVLGKEVQTLVNQQLSPGTYQADFDGSNLPSGVYYYKLVVGDGSASLTTGNTNNAEFSETKKMVLIK